MGGVAVEEGMEPGWSSESNNMRAADVLVIWGRGLRVPGRGTRCRGQLWGCCCWVLGVSCRWPCTKLLSFPQSLQSDKEALQEGRGAVVKYRRTADGYIQIGAEGVGRCTAPSVW